MIIRPQLPPKPFNLPLSRAAFEASLQRGQGRALLHTKRTGGAEVADLIVDACTHAMAYDDQCEDRRTPWLLRLIEVANIESTVVAALTEALKQPQHGDRFWDMAQMCDLARELAQRGHEAARQALYDSLAFNENSANLIAVEDIVRLDGADGLLHVVGTLGRWMSQDDSIDVDDEPLAIYDEIHGKGAAKRILESASSDPDIAFYLRELTQLELQQRSRNSAKANAVRKNLDGWSAEQIVEHIRSDESEHHSYLLGRWGRKASVEDLQIVADAMAEESQLPDLR